MIPNFVEALHDINKQITATSGMTAEFKTTDLHMEEVTVYGIFLTENKKEFKFDKVDGIGDIKLTFPLDKIKMISRSEEGEYIINLEQTEIILRS
jgi:hypothetical protein